MKPWLILLFCVGAARVNAAEPVNLLKNGTFEGGLTSWFLKNPDRCQTEKTLISNTALSVSFSQALSIDVSPQAQDKPWSVVLRQEINAPLSQGKQLVFRVWLRSPQSATVTGFIEAAKAPYAKVLIGEWKLSPDWKEFEISGPCPQDFAAGGTNCGFFLSHGKASIRLADARLFCVDKKVALAPLTPIKPVPLPQPPKLPAVLLKNGEFKEGLENWRMVGAGVGSSLLIAKAGTYERVLEMRTTPILNTPAVPPPFFQSLSQKIEAPLDEGDGLTLKLWLRSKDNCPVTLRVDDNDMAAGALIDRLVRLTPEWKEYEAQGRCAKDYEPGALQCALWLGHQPGSVEIAGVRLDRTPDAPASWGVVAKIPKTFNRENLLDNGDFTDNAPKMGFNGPIAAFGKWIVSKTDNFRPEIVAAEAGPFKSALHFTLTPLANSNFSPRIEQAVETPPLTANDALVLRFWAHGTDGRRVNCSISRNYKERQNNANSFTMKTASGAGQTITLSPEWKEYEVRLGAKAFSPNAPDTTTQANVTFSIEPIAGEMEITGLRLAIEAPAP